MRLISFDRTWPKYLDGSKDATRRFKQVWTDGERYFPKPGPGLAKIWIPSWWNHRKDEPTLKPGEVFEGVEWSPRVGPRWCCSGDEPGSPSCGHVGGKALEAGLRLADPLCQCGNDLVSRLPARGELSRHLGTTVVRLGGGHGCSLCGGSGWIGFPPSPRESGNCYWCGGGGSEEAAREGFPGLSWGTFLERCFPGVPLDSEVARIEFERIER